jgi:hypothetical protein
LTDRLSAEVLVVEGWIGKDGIRAAAAEFERGGYHYIETTVDEIENRQDHSSDNAEVAKEELIRLGIPQDIAWAPPDYKSRAVVAIRPAHQMFPEGSRRLPV